MTAADFGGGLVPVDDHVRAARYYEARGLCIGLAVVGTVALLAACIYWPQFAGVRVLVPSEGDGGGGLPVPSMRERAQAAASSADALLRN